MKGIVVIIASVVLSVAVLVGAWELKLLPPNRSTQAEAASPPPAATINYSLPERVVNLADSSGERYLKIQVTLAFSDPDSRGEKLSPDALAQRQADLTRKIDPYKPEIEDFLTSALTRETARELLTPAGKDALRQTILDGVGKRVPGVHLVAVYLTQFIIQ